MSAISISIAPSKASPFLIDKGGLQEPFLNGPVLRVNRLGLRLGARFVIPPKRYGTQGAALIADLIGAVQSGIIVPFPQPGITVGSESAPKVKTAVSGGTSLALKGLPAAKALGKGWMITINVASEGGQRYMHPLASAATADGSGDVTVTLAIPIRTAFAVNDVVEIAAPKLQGHLIDERLAWEMSVDRMLDVGFGVAESR